MVLKIPQTKEMSYSLLIESHAHEYLPITPTPFKDYVSENLVCRAMSLSHDQLYLFLLHSKMVHGVELPTGALLVHPHGLFAYHSKKYKKKLSSLKRELARYMHSIRPVAEDIH